METLESGIILPDDNSPDKTKAHIGPSRPLAPSQQTRIPADALIAYYFSQETTTEEKTHEKPTTLDNLG